MLKRFLGRFAFREFLKNIRLMDFDSGPIIAGGGVAATGLGLNAASTMKDRKHSGLLKTMNLLFYIKGMEKVVVAQFYQDRNRFISIFNMVKCRDKAGLVLDLI